MNKYFHVGRFVAAPELKMATNGKNVVSFTLAVHRPFTKDKTDFFEYVAWGELAERIARSFTKGQTIAVSGHEELNRWQDEAESWRSRNIHIVEEFDFCNNSKRAEATHSTNDAFEELCSDLCEDDECPF